MDSGQALAQGMTIKGILGRVNMFNLNISENEELRQDVKKNLSGESSDPMAAYLGKQDNHLFKIYFSNYQVPDYGTVPSAFLLTLILLELEASKRFWQRMILR